MPAEPEVHAPFLTSLLTHILVISGLCLDFPAFKELSKYLGSERVCVMYSEVCGWKVFYSHNLTSCVSHPLIISSHSLAPQFSCMITYFQLIFLENRTENLRAYLVIFSSMIFDFQWSLLKCLNVRSAIQWKRHDLSQGASRDMMKCGHQWLNTIRS